MSIALDAPILLYTLQTLKESEQDQDPTSENNNVTPGPNILQALPTEPVSIPAFVNSVLHPPPYAPLLYVTSIEWRAAPSCELHHDYAVIRASIATQSAPTVAIRIDRYGGLGLKLPWWRRRPGNLSAHTDRASTTVVAGFIGDNLADPSLGRSVVECTHWTQEIPASGQIPELRRALERARSNACTALNHAIRPHITYDLHMPQKQARQGRRWADSRGLHFVHLDIASTVADAMNVGIIRCGIHAFWTAILPNRMLWRSVQRSTRVREEYSRVVQDYRQELRQIILSLADLDPTVRSKISISWGIEESENHHPLLVQLLNQSLSRQAFISPGAPMATLSDVASRLDTIVPLLPPSGPTVNLCTLSTQILLARFPDDLWHSYTTPVPPVPVSISRAIWYRAKNSRTFWLTFEIGVQWVVALALIPVHWMSEIWVLLLPFIHLMVVFPWVLKERKAWRKIWRVYEGAIVESEVVEWENDANTLSSQSKMSLLSTKGDAGKTKMPL